MSQRPVVILTGASRGIGHATVKRFSAEGWLVITCSREPVPPECLRDPNWSIHIVADLADPDSRTNFIAEANKALDGAPLHGLINNAGMSPKTPFKERLGCLNGDLNGWRNVFELNFFAPIVLARGFAGALARGKGIIAGPSNLLGIAYRQAPIAITVEGANLLTRAHLLSKPLLLIHGTADDNVLFDHSLKLIQALPLVTSGAADAFGLSEAQLALACASHGGEPEHVATAAAMLAQAGLDEAALECGSHWPSYAEATHALARQGGTPGALHNNCSGKHAGFV